jgi:hypothetical protein
MEVLKASRQERVQPSPRSLNGLMPHRMREAGRCVIAPALLLMWG